MSALLGSPRRRWYLLALAWLILLILGIGGFLQQAADADLDRSPLDTFYLTLQLVTLEYGAGSAALNWRLEIVRFVAPIMAASTVLQTASVVFEDQFTRLRTRRRGGHVVVCGLGDTGSRLAIAYAEAGYQVVAVEIDRTAPGVAAAEARDVTVLVGDATDPAQLRDARVPRAARLIAVCGTDATNVEVTAAARALDREAGAPALRCAVHLADTELCRLLTEEALGGEGHVRLGFFDLGERAARAWVAEHPPFGDGSRPPHMLVLGLGQLGQSYVLAAVQRWADVGDGSPLRCTLVDRHASGRWEALRLRHPGLDTSVLVAPLDMDVRAPGADAVAGFRRVLDDGDVTGVAVLFEDETLALSTALFVHEALGAPAPVVVRSRTGTGLATLVRRADGTRAVAFPHLALFPVLDRTCTVDAIEGGVREQLARATHEDYLAHLGAGSFARPWDDLTDAERELSRSAADSVVAALDRVGYELVPLRHWPAGLTGELPVDVVEAFAAAEHERWRAERTAAGWTQGPVRDDARRHNPLLVPWDQLPDDVRAANRASTGGLPARLARAGFELARRSPPATR